jgi:hypothetical protein
MNTLQVPFSTFKESYTFEVDQREISENRTRTAIEEAVGLVQSEMSRTPDSVNYRVALPLTRYGYRKKTFLYEKIAQETVVKDLTQRGFIVFFTDSSMDIKNPMWEDPEFESKSFLELILERTFSFITWLKDQET